MFRLIALVLCAVAACCLLMPAEADAGFKLFGSQTSNVNINANGVPVQVQVKDRGLVPNLLGRRDQVNVNVAGRNFGNVANVNFNERAKANFAIVNGQLVELSNQRFNAFGTRTVQDKRGNVFEVDAFGNARLVRSSSQFVNFDNRRLGVSRIGTSYAGSNGFSVRNVRSCNH